MEYLVLGRSGLNVSVLSFGFWVNFGEQVGKETADDGMVEACNADDKYGDHAEEYGNGKSDRMMGQILQKTGWKRTDLVLSTKIFWGGPGPNDQGLSSKHIKEGTEAALKRLQTDYVDLLFCHRPDRHTLIEETV